MGCNIDQNAQDGWQRVARHATLGFLVSQVMLVKKWQKIYSVYSCLMHFKEDFMSHYDVGCEHTWECEHLMVWQRL